MYCVSWWKLCCFWGKLMSFASLLPSCQALSWCCCCMSIHSPAEAISIIGNEHFQDIFILIFILKYSIICTLDISSTAECNKLM